MDADSLKAHHSDFQSNIKSLNELSKPKDNDEKQAGKQPVLAGFDISGKLDAVDFDEIRKKWYPWIKGRNVPCSADALVFQEKGEYLIEFKSGDNPDKTNLFRKAYDSVMMLTEHDTDNLTYEKARENITYIVVATALSPRNSMLKALTRSASLCKTPWTNDEIMRQYDRWKLYNLEGVLISKVYCMPPKMFDDFVKAEQWI